MYWLFHNMIEQKASSSSFCTAITNLPDLLSPTVSIVDRSRQVF